MRVPASCWLLVIGLLPGMCRADPDLSERFVAAIRNNRSARFVFEYKFHRASPLLEVPLTSDYQVQTLILQNTGRVVTLTSDPDDSTVLLRSENVRRQNEMMSVNVTVSASLPSERQPNKFVGLLLHSPSISISDQKVGPQELLNRAPYNLALGVILGLPIEDYLGKSADREYRETKDGVVCISQTNFGKCTASWADSMTVYPTTFTLQVSGNDVLYDSPITTVTLHGGKGWPAGGLIAVTAEISGIRTKQYGTNIVPVEWTCIDTYDCADGTKVIEQCEVHVVDVEFDADPSNAENIGVDLPIGQSVTIRDAPHLTYYWDGDWAVPTLQSLTPVAKWSHRIYLMVVNLAVCFLILFAIFLWKRRQTK